MYVMIQSLIRGTIPSPPKMSDKHINEPAHDKTYNKPCTTSEDSDKHAHPRSLIIVFADLKCLLQPPGYPMKDEREPMPYWMNVQADLCICWLHRSCCG